MVLIMRRPKMKIDKSKSFLMTLQEKFLYFVLIVVSGMCLTLCFQDTINYDEFFSVQWCRLPWLSGGGVKRHSSGGLSGMYILRCIIFC